MWYINTFDIDTDIGNKCNKTCRFQTNYHLSSQMIVCLRQKKTCRSPNSSCGFPLIHKCQHMRRQTANTDNPPSLWQHWSSILPRICHFSTTVFLPLSLPLPEDNSSTCGLLINGSIHHWRPNRYWEELCQGRHTPLGFQQMCQPSRVRVCGHGERRTNQFRFMQTHFGERSPRPYSQPLRSCCTSRVTISPLEKGSRVRLELAGWWATRAIMVLPPAGRPTPTGDGAAEKWISELIKASVAWQRVVGSLVEWLIKDSLLALIEFLKGLNAVLRGWAGC